MKVVLWHLPISHYNEKVRWALSWKGIEHERRAPPPGVHMAIALALTRGRTKTCPVLQLDGQTIGDSTRIIAALEEHQPEPPLYPADPLARARALELEDFFDEELGPHIRLLAWHEAVRDEVALNRFSQALVPRPLRPVAGKGMTTFLRLRFGVEDEDAAELARRKVHAAMDRLDTELGDGSYLVGDTFTVADLTAAALFYPLVTPPEGPRLPPDPPAAFEEFRAPLKERRGYRWVEEMFARHRRNNSMTSSAPRPVSSG
jgi:glutathione S-transferase